MDIKAHRATQARIQMIAEMVAQTEIDTHVARLERAAEVGPIADPTFWAQKGDSMLVELEFAKALRDFRNEAMEIAGRAVPALLKARSQQN